MPQRIQRRRVKGFNLQAASSNPNGVVYVGRPTIFGNPFTVEEYGKRSLELFADWLQDEGVARYWAQLDHQRGVLLHNLSRLRGKDLACWCPLDSPCHADVLLALANKP